MTKEEFLSEFDLYYNNTMSNKAPGLNEYEISVFLTKAQDEILKNYLNPNGNKYREGFDNSTKRQIDFYNLIKNVSVSSGEITETTSIGIDDRIKSYLLPSDIFIILNEVAIVKKNNSIIKTQVIPLHYLEYTRLMSKPYQEPLKRQTWRLLSEGIVNNVIQSELIPKSGYDIDDYKLRYIRKPRPIIVVDLEQEFGEGVSINGYTQPVITPSGDACELDPILHREILDRAVEIAISSSFGGDLSTIVQLNQRNE